MSTNLIRPLFGPLRYQCTILASLQESSSKIPQSFTHIRSAHLTPSPSSKPEPKGGRPTKIGIVIRSFDDQPLEKNNWGIPPNTSKIGLPESRVLYTVLRSPHIDKKSREQFHMEIKKQYLVIKAQRHELRNKFFWLKRQRIVGAQYEIQFSCKTRLDLSKLQSVLHQQEGSQSQVGV